MGNEIPETCVARKAVYWVAIAAITFALGLAICNEIRLIYHRNTLQPLIENYTSVSCVPSDSHNGKFIYMVCPVQDLYNFYPPSAFSRNLGSFSGIFLETKVEMYQRAQKAGLWGPYSASIFTEQLIGSTGPSSFTIGQTSQNPLYFPSVAGRGRAFAPVVKAGGFTVSPSLLTQLSAKQQLPLHDDGWFVPAPSRPPLVVDYMNTYVKNDALYTGNPNSPQLGDLRITFWGSSATYLSFLGSQLLKDRTVFISDSNGFSKDDTPTILIEGEHTVEELVQITLAKMNGDATTSWIIRILSVAVTSGIAYFYLRHTATDKPVWALTSLSILSGIAANLLISATIWVHYQVSVSAGLLSLSMLCAVAALAIWVYTSPTAEQPHNENLTPLFGPRANRRTPSAPSIICHFNRDGTNGSL